MEKQETYVVICDNCNCRVENIRAIEKNGKVECGTCWFERTQIDK